STRWPAMMRPMSVSSTSARTCVIERVPGLGSKAAHVKQNFLHKLIEHRNYIDQRGDDMPEIENGTSPIKQQRRPATDVHAKQREPIERPSLAEIVTVNAGDRNVIISAR